LAPRPVRQPIGDGWLPAIIGAAGSSSIVTLTRAGWANPAGIQRPALQRVTYILENGTLRREHWPVLDAVLTTTTVRRELLDKVKSITLRYMDVSFQWRDQWPQQALAGDPTSNLRLRPIAVEVTLELEDWGKLVRVIEVAG
jgi:general secretion pathway protein J